MATEAQINCRIPVAAKRQLRGILALQGLSYTEWLRGQVQQFIRENDQQQQGQTLEAAGSVRDG